MKEEKKNWLMGFIVPVSIAIAAIVLMAVLEQPWAQESVADVIGKVSDCFSVPGILLTGVGALGWIASKGTFDLFTYGAKTLWGHFSKKTYEELPRNLYDYKVAQDEKGRKWNVQLLITGIITLALGILLVIVYLVLASS